MSPAVRPDDRRAWGAAVALAGLLLAVDGAMVWAFRVRPWTLVVPGVVLAVALRGRSATLASWRDLLGILCLVTIPFVGLLPPDAPRPMRFALNSLGTAGAVLLAIGVILDDGIGAGVRRRDLGALVEGARQAFVRFTMAGSLLLLVVGAPFFWNLSGVPRALLAFPFLMIVAGFFPERLPGLATGLKVVGCLGFLVAIGGAIAGIWPWICVPLFAISTTLTDDARKLVAPVAPKGAGAPKVPRAPVAAGRAEEAVGG